MASLELPLRGDGGSWRLLREPAPNKAERNHAACECGRTRPGITGAVPGVPVPRGVQGAWVPTGASFNGLDPPIAARGHCLQVTGRAGVVAEHAPQLRHHARQGMIGDRRVGPERVEDFLLGEQMARAPHHQREQVECLGLERKRDAGAFKTIAVEVKDEVVPSITGGHCQENTRAGRER